MDSIVYGSPSIAKGMPIGLRFGRQYSMFSQERNHPVRISYDVDIATFRDLSVTELAHTANLLADLVHRLANDPVWAATQDLASRLTFCLTGANVIADLFRDRDPAPVLLVA